MEQVARRRTDDSKWTPGTPLRYVVTVFCGVPGDRLPWRSSRPTVNASMFGSGWIECAQPGRDRPMQPVGKLPAPNSREPRLISRYKSYKRTLVRCLQHRQISHETLR
ncbi:hypothetical protein ZHAS_00021663 [Anopheles sinensis]|uniref:Uncharacterized protein n=1 Tax=Anopheles sinensis TaxID=74873 RepID=A0A084WT10_ANOSI|nr:hypothetical protein ZHAS_00021663 [Anopheles sinensis]